MKQGLTVRPRPPLDLPVLPQRTTDWPDDEPLDPDTVRAALWHGAGNLQKASTLLRCKPGRLGALLRRDPILAEERRLASELQVDRAEEVILDALADETDNLRRDEAARFILNHAGRSRGWTKDGGAPVQMNFGDGSAKAQAAGVTISWQAPEPAALPAKVIDHE